MAHIKNPITICLILLVASLALHFIGLWHPKEVVFDEVHFGKYASYYLKGDYFLLLHPPLAQLLIAGFVKLMHVVPHYSFENIGEVFPDWQYIWFRSLPALIGSLLAPLVFLLTRRISKSIYAATIAGTFVLFENGILVQSKFILLDAFLLFFGFLALYLFSQSKVFFAESKWGWITVIGAALSAGMAFSVKWVGAAFWMLILLFGFTILLNRLFSHAKSKDVKKLFGAFAILILLPLAFYTSLYVIHFKLLPNPGTGNAFMNARFNESQVQGFPLKDFFSNFIELNYETFKGNVLLTATHSYSSRWYTWPFMIRPIYYWTHDNAVTDTHPASYEKIYFIGNPFVWWLSSIIGVIFVILWFKNFFSGLFTRFKETISKELHPGDSFLALGFLMNWLPFIVIGRATFLYHYLASLIFAVMMTAIFFDRIIKKNRLFWGIGLIAAALIVFIYFAPLSYGLPLSQAWPSRIFLFKTWI